MAPWTFSCEPAEIPPVESEAFLTEQVLTYIGNKRALLPFIDEGVKQVKSTLGKDRLDTFDVFAGSGVVSRYLKQHSRKLISCDLERYCEVVNSCYLSNRSDIDVSAIEALVTRVNDLANERPRPGVLAELYAPSDEDDIQPGERVFYTPRNAIKIDTVRALIDELVPEDRQVYVLAPLLYMASVHANTSGVFKGFYKNSATGLGQYGGNGRNALTRICKPIELPAPVFSRFECEVEVLRGDSNKIAPTLPAVDLAYLDPPYNQHPYGSNYFMLNLIADGGRPGAASAVSGIPDDWNRSNYNRRGHARDTLWDLVRSINARFLLISFNSEGFIPRAEMSEMLESLGRTEVLETRYNAFRGSRNLGSRGLHVAEYLYVVDRGA
jgi:adenine-specific DNA-methyltransferase